MLEVKIHTQVKIGHLMEVSVYSIVLPLLTGEPMTQSNPNDTLQRYVDWHALMGILTFKFMYVITSARSEFCCEFC